MASSLAAGRYARPTVLVIDDEPGTQRMLDRLLSFHGFAPFQATDLPEAFLVAEREPIDAFVVGLTPGRVAALDILHWLRQHRDYARAPVFVLTGHDDLAADMQSRIREYRARVFFKGQSLELLIDRLQRLLCEPAPIEPESEPALP